MSIDLPKNTPVPEIPKYSILEAKKDLFYILTSSTFQTPEVDLALKRLLSNKRGVYLILFLSHQPDLIEEIKSKNILQPLVQLIQQPNLQMPNFEEYPQYLQVAHSLNNELALHHKNKL